MDAHPHLTPESDPAPSDTRSVGGDPPAPGGGEAAARTEIELDHPTDAVWRALVDPERLVRWMGPGSDIEARPGGRVAVDDPATGTPREGRVTRVDDGRRLDLEWWPEDDPGRWSEVSFVVAARPGGSTLTVIETLPPVGSDRVRALACARAATSWRLASLAVLGFGGATVGVVAPVGVAATVAALAPVRA